MTKHLLTLLTRFVWLSFIAKCTVVFNAAMLFLATTTLLSTTDKEGSALFVVIWMALNLYAMFEKP